MTLQYALALLDLKELPEGLDPEFFRESTDALVQRNGEEWMRRHKYRLRDELDYIASL